MAAAWAARRRRTPRNTMTCFPSPILPGRKTWSGVPGPGVGGRGGLTSRRAVAARALKSESGALGSASAIDDLTCDSPRNTKSGYTSSHNTPR